MELQRKRTIMDMVRCMLKKKNMPAEFWAEAVLCDVYLINRSPKKSLQNTSPNEAWHGKKPNILCELNLMIRLKSASSMDAILQVHQICRFLFLKKKIHKHLIKIMIIEMMEKADMHKIHRKDPITFKEESKEEKLNQAMKEEIKSIEKNDTRELTSLPLHKYSIGVKWIFKTKTNQDSSFNKYKARLVAKGYKQKEDEDFNEVFAPVSRLDTIRLLISLAAQNFWKLFLVDVKSAFLNGYLQEEIYFEQPLGFVKKGEEYKVFKLKKALYGLKQSPRAWYIKETIDYGIFYEAQVSIKLVGYTDSYVDLVLHGKTENIRLHFHFLRELVIIRLHFNFLRELVNDREIKVEYCRSDEQLADVLTKSLGTLFFQEMLQIWESRENLI
ncbi:uncharacterized protein [Henckelia pumila]|uniref:uncharacterized protein n=1 Tax=Henckelia pumila TaxID=405737 RepID=UPI003C6DE49E